MNPELIKQQLPATVDIDDNEIRELISELNANELNELVCDLDGYKQSLVDIEQFINDPLYLGRSLKGHIYPIWEDVLKEIYPVPYYSPWSEVSFSGAIGIGKSTVARIGVLYDSYKLLMLSDPHERFDLIKSDLIIAALFSATLELSALVLYEPFRALIKNSPFFKTRLLTGTRDKDTGPIKFPNKFEILGGSRFTHVLGLAVFCGLLDEASFQGAVGGQAYDSYTAMSRRMQSRFMQKGGTVPGHLFLVSSKKNENAFLEAHIKKNRNNPGFKCYEFSLWDVKAHTGIYSGATFPVFVGNDRQSPKILKEHEEKEYNPEEIVHPPVEFLNTFKVDLENSLRDIAGKTSIVGSKYISVPEAITKAIKLVNLGRDDYIFLDFEDDRKLIDFIDVEKLQLYLNILPNASRFIHLDIGVTNDAYGFAMCSCSDYRKVQSRKEPDGPQEGLELIVEPVIRCELAFGIKTKTRVPFFKIREFIDDLADIGFPITNITADSFESEDTLQLMKKKGYKTAVLSMDKTKKPHITFRNALYENRLELPDHPIMFDELSNLIDTGKKFDHLPGKTKDISDAIIGATYTCINTAHAFIETYGVDDIFN